MRRGRRVTELPVGSSWRNEFLTGHAANADVDAVGEIEVMRWTAGNCRTARPQPGTLVKIQSVAGIRSIEKDRARRRTASGHNTHPAQPQTMQPRRGNIRRTARGAHAISAQYVLVVAFGNLSSLHAQGRQATPPLEACGAIAATTWP